MLALRGEQVSIVEGLPAVLGQNGPLCYANTQMLQDLIAFPPTFRSHEVAWPTT